MFGVLWFRVSSLRLRVQDRNIGGFRALAPFVLDLSVRKKNEIRKQRDNTRTRTDSSFGRAKMFATRSTISGWAPRGTHAFERGDVPEPRRRKPNP